MADIIQTLSAVKFSYWASWWSAVGCFLMSFYAAKYVSDRPRLTSVLAIFAGAWVLVTAAYAARIQTIGVESPSVEQIALGDRAMDMAAFLMVLAGAALAREGGREHWANKVQRWVQLGGLWLMFYLVLPENIPLKLPLTDRQIDLVVGELLGILGFVSLAIGVSAVAGAGITIALVLTLITYEAAGLSRMLELLPDAANARNPMHAVVVYGIAICRVMVTAIVCYVVVIHCRSVRDVERKEQVRGELLKEQEYAGAEV